MTTVRPATIDRTAFTLSPGRAARLKPRASAALSGLARVMAVSALAALLPGLAAAQSKDELQASYKSRLDELGYRPSVSDMGNVLFKAEGHTYVIYLDEKDPKFFRLVLAFQAPAAAGEDQNAKRHKALNDATRTTKTVKAYVADSGATHFAVEEFQATPGDATANLPRMIRAIQAANTKYVQAMR